MRSVITHKERDREDKKQAGKNINTSNIQGSFELHLYHNRKLRSLRGPKPNS
jgi:hypothetical protein